MNLSIFVRLLAFLSVAFLIFSCNNEDCFYIYSLSADELYVYEEGDLLQYSCSDGTADTFLVGEVFTTLTVEDYGQGIFSDKVCTYSTTDCYVHLQNLNGFWVTILDYGTFASRPDSTHCFRIRRYGEFSNGEPSSCSWIESGCDDFVLGHLAQKCFEGITGESLTIEGVEYANVFTLENMDENAENGNGIHYRVYWNLSHGIIRFEDLQDSPVRRWDLNGKIK